MQDDMSQEEIDAILSNAMGAASDSDPEADAADESPPEQASSDTVQPAFPEQVDAGTGEPDAGTAPGQPQADTSQTAPAAYAGVANINFLLDVPLDVAVELGRTRIAIKDMLQLGPGSVIELDKLIGEPVDLLVNDKLIAKGEVVVFDENFGIRITDIINPEDRLKSLR